MQETLVAILLCTYQGESFLAKQLDSIEQQTYPHWVLYVSDDGSKDNTVSILKHYAEKWEKQGSKKLLLSQGPHQGFAANFMSLLLSPSIQADYYAFADQDDIWEKDKLMRALQILQNLPNHQPSLYCSRTLLIDEHDKPIGFSTLYTKPPCFKNALVQNIASGNTMVFNQAARALTLKLPITISLPFHDWWIYLVVAGCEGLIKYDAYPSVRYRQHANNAIGANQSYFALCFRLRLLFKGEFVRWNDKNLQALMLLQSSLAPVNQQLLTLYQYARKSALLARLMGFAKIGIFRQTFTGNLKLIGAALLKKI